MRPVAILTAALAIVPSTLAEGKKSALVWFEDDSIADELVQKAKDAITKAGGTITHTYDIIKGFSAEGPEDAFAEVKVQFEQDQSPMPVIEDDSPVGPYNG